MLISDTQLLQFIKDMSTIAQVVDRLRDEITVLADLCSQHQVRIKELEEWRYGVPPEDGT